MSSFIQTMRNGWLAKGSKPFQADLRALLSRSKRGSVDTTVSIVGYSSITSHSEISWDALLAGLSRRCDIDDRKRSEEETARRRTLRSAKEIVKASMFEEIVGSSPALQTVLSSVVRVAPTDSTVLITGETGTGKELIARAIHKHSQRSGQAFISVNCASIPSSLIASELFGHEKGAFTGAVQRRQYRFELAHSGTIF